MNNQTEITANKNEVRSLEEAVGEGFNLVYGSHGAKYASVSQEQYGAGTLRIEFEQNGELDVMFIDPSYALTLIRRYFSERGV